MLGTGGIAAGPMGEDEYSMYEGVQVDVHKIANMLTDDPDIFE